jgi:hypothetical protein
MHERAPTLPQAAEPATRARSSKGLPDAPAVTAAPEESLAASHLIDLAGSSASAGAGSTALPEKPGPVHLTPRSVMALQRSVGNRAVMSALRSTLQRVEVKTKDSGETLYNQAGTGGTAGAKHYGGGAKTYDMSRSGDASVTVTVKIKFLSQTRNTTPPTPPATRPAVGELTGPQTEIAASDSRRTWATEMAPKAVDHWNGHLALIGEERNVFSENTKKRLTVTFQAIPVWGKDEDADDTVVVHPETIAGGSAGNPIDAGNYYTKKKDDVYPASDDVIYAHEYGHLLGLPDEYSQSNEQLNLLLHQAAPASAASSMAALDRATVEKMAYAALKAPMFAQLDAVLPSIVNALEGAQPRVKSRMAQAARTGVVSADVTDELRAQLAAKSEAKLAPSIPGVVAFETARNFSNLDLAAQGVSAGFESTALTTMIRDEYWKALGDPLTKTVAIKDYGDVMINVKSSVTATTGTGGAQAANATGAAATSIGAPPAGPGLPMIAPPASLAGQLSTLPATWAAAGSALETSVTPEAYATKVKGILAVSGALGQLAALLPGGTPPPKVASTKGLYEEAYGLLTNAAKEAARQLASDLLSSQISPILQASVTSIQSDIQTEVNRIMTTPPAGLAAAPANPNMAAIVSAMKAKLDASKAATAGTGLDPLAKTGSTSPDQDVTYSYQGLMGSNKSTALRADQFQPLVDAFNAKLKKLFETAFTAEVK